MVVRITNLFFFYGRDAVQIGSKIPN